MECFRLQKHKIVNCNRQNIVKFAKYTLQKLGKTVGWRWQNVTISEKMAAIHPKHFEEMEYFRV